MESINSQPLEDMLEAQPVSILRVVLASIFGFIFFIVGTFFSVLNHLGVF